jgi:hypothetical protein
MRFFVYTLLAWIAFYALLGVVRVYANVNRSRRFRRFFATRNPDFEE